MPKKRRRPRNGPRKLLALMTNGQRNPARLMSALGVGPRRFLDILALPSVRRFRRTELLAESILNAHFPRIPLDAQDLHPGDVDHEPADIIEACNQALTVAGRSTRAAQELRGILSPFTIRWVAKLADDPSDP